MFKSYREESKANWGMETEQNLTREQVQLGAVLRIADSVEKMAQNYDALLRDRNWYKQHYQEQSEVISRLQRSQAGLRGYIKRLKK